MLFYLNETSIYDIIPPVLVGIMHTWKKDYWTERGFSSREEWLESRMKSYRKKTAKQCLKCGVSCWGNRVYCSNKCTILDGIEKNESGCWEWIKSKNPSGYGIFKNLDDRTQKSGNKMRGMLAHRASYIIYKGEIPPGKFVCHSCDNRGCVNPDHLWLGSPKDNARDALKKGKLHLEGLTYQLKKGCKSPASKLEPYISEIKKRIESGERIAEIAEIYEVTPQTIYSIKHGKTWKGDYGGV
jgi:Autographiviridae endonuclease